MGELRSEVPARITGAGIDSRERALNHSTVHSSAQTSRWRWAEQRSLWERGRPFPARPAWAHLSEQGRSRAHRQERPACPGPGVASTCGFLWAVQWDPYRSHLASPLLQRQPTGEAAPAAGAMGWTRALLRGGRVPLYVSSPLCEVRGDLHIPSQHFRNHSGVACTVPRQPSPNLQCDGIRTGFR